MESIHGSDDEHEGARERSKSRTPPDRRAEYDSNSLDAIRPSRALRTGERRLHPTGYEPNEMRVDDGGGAVVPAMSSTGSWEHVSGVESSRVSTSAVRWLSGNRLSSASIED